MTGDLGIMLAAFGAVASGVLLAALLLDSRRKRIAGRLADVSPSGDRGGPLQSSTPVLPNLGSVIMPQKEPARQKLRSQLRQAGLYRAPAAGVFLGIKFLLMVTPVMVGVAMWAGGLLSMWYAVTVGAAVGLLGALAPMTWIRTRAASRQMKIRRALPDALDVLVICLEGGLSLPAAFARVTEELSTAYPLLGSEMAIVRRHLELGHSTADAFRDMAERFDSEELRSMAVLIAQSERFGASLVRSLRVQADSFRTKRYQWAEAQSQKAPVKLLFPTILCIFPAYFVVLVGPAVIQVIEMLGRLGRH